MASAVEDDVMSEMKRRSSVMTLRVESLAHVRENIQKKTFTRWANMSLPPEDKISDLFEELRSGDLLLKLVNILAQTSLRPERGKMEIHQRTNIGRALDALARVEPQHGISISAIFEGIPKLTLALLWHLILRYSHIQGETGVSPEAHCRQWCGSATDGYPGLEDIGKDFLGAWVTGLVLPALINRNNPDLIDYSDMYHNKNPEERFQISFDVAEKYYEVPKLLDVEDMNRMYVDDQSVTTYLMALNKVLTDDVPDIPPEVVKLAQNTQQASIIVEEDEDQEEKAETNEEMFCEEDLSDEDLTPVDHVNLPSIIAERDTMLSTTPEQKSPEDEDKDSGLELVDSPVLQNDKVVLREHLRDESSQRGSTITLDSETEYISATSSPVGSRKALNDSEASDPGSDGTLEHLNGTEHLSSEHLSSEHLSSEHLSSEHLSSEHLSSEHLSSEHLSSEHLINNDSSEIREPLAELEALLEEITTLPDNIPVTVVDLEELKLLLKERGEECADLQKRIHMQLNHKQERYKRADLHKFLAQTGRFEDALQSSAAEVNNLIQALEEFESSVDSCQQFADSAQEVLSEEDVPCTAEESEVKLSEQQALLSQLEEQQRNLEYSYRSLNRAMPQIISLSVQEQRRVVTSVQNTLSDIEAVLNGSVETLSFLSSRLPSLEQKLRDADEIITRAENEIEGGEGINPEQLQLQVERANTHLGTVDNLFLAIESFSSEFNLEPLRSEWEDLTERATRAARQIREQLVAEEALSEEVVAVADWAETLEHFLHKKKMKPTDNRKQLREDQGKWKLVAEDLNSKCAEIEVLLQSNYSTEDHRVMSPLDKDTLVSLKNQLNSLRSPLHVRRELLQAAYSNWGNVECHIKSLSENMLNMEFARTCLLHPPSPSWHVRAMFRYIDELADSEADLAEQAQQLQTLVHDISQLPGLIVDTATIVKERGTLLNKHTVLCKRATNKRLKTQRACVTLQPVTPFLKAQYVQKLKWLYNQDLPDIDSRRDHTSAQMVATLQGGRHRRPRRYSEWWHVIKTIAPEKLPYMLLTWVAFAVGPWGMGCSTDRPMNIVDYTPDILI